MTRVLKEKRQVNGLKNAHVDIMLEKIEANEN
jgi:hypothetical protein